MKKTTKQVPKAAAKRVTAKKAAAPARRTPTPPAAAKARTPKPEPAAPAVAEPDALLVFAKAVQTFRSGAFQDAKRLFDRLLDSPSREVAHAARLHSRMCEQRLGKQAPTPTTAEDLYNYGIALMNARNLDSAQKQFEAALQLAPQADHVSYALALCMGLKGDLPSSYQHLRRAIELQPRNRSLARNDPDFAELLRRAPLSELIAQPSH